MTTTHGDLYALVAAHCAGASLAVAAEAAGMSRTTAWRRLQTDEARSLIAEVADRRREALVGWADAVRGAADLALAAVVEMLESNPEPAVVCRIAGTLLPEVRQTAALERMERLQIGQAEAHPVDHRDALRTLLGLD